VWWSIWWSRWTDGFVMDEQGRKMSKSTVTAQYGSTIYTYD
jgi:isoleucyl-tRNA synthetase